MAKFKMQLPDDIIKDCEFLNKNSSNIWCAMTRAGANVVIAKIQAGIPQSFRKSNIMNCLKITKDYYTKTDDGWNTKVAFYGYFSNRNNEIVPAPLVCNLFEYGRSYRDFPKKPFMRKAFRGGDIRKAMLQAQEEASKGLLKNE